MQDLLSQAYDPEAFRQQGHQLIDQLADYLAQARAGTALPVMPWREPAEQLARWQQESGQPNDATDPLALLQAVVQESIHLHHPRYMGHQVCAPVPLAALAGLVSNLLNNGAAVYEMGSVSTALEKIVVGELARAIGFPLDADGVLTSGGTLANLTALLAARQLKAGFNAWHEGTEPRLALLVSEEAHYCVSRAVKVMGWGEGGIIKVPVNDRFQIRLDALEDCKAQAEAEGRQVIAVVGSACSTSTGAYDDLNGLADFCDRHGLWLHVDGAHGGGVVFSEKYRSRVRGLERADSVAIDFHKMLMTPALVTGLVFRQGKHAYASFAQRAQYLLGDTPEDEWYNLAHRTYECTKLMMSLKVYTLLRTYGPALFAQNVDRLYDLAQTFAQKIQAHPQFQLPVAPQANIVCFRYCPEGEADLNALNRRIRRQLLEEGNFYIVQTQLGSDVYLRTTLMNPFTSETDLDALLTEVERIGTTTQTTRVEA
ncbi:L-2,4-diaminobutyrate decarboxylase [Catalinimonas alkaloidigena]|uniref:L-2,4-diaminobutyrate decarboxylase n=1 Tax=Catalinimonas alkaloidigena TaxID=1075417 RepID=A0A1G8WAS7_9BACT|nr:aminotransferase class I/II-fold pyridoxal phosphate-dependent enzyme [Catalinimonas alkaloidigena]SDJ74835.1 L-2,4-diaminobutyrate decarboxylase [Catalinimonas alkaloidigena]